MCSLPICSVMLSSLHRLQPASLLCQQDLSGKNTGLPFPSPEDLPNSGIKPVPPASLLHWQMGYLPLSHQRIYPLRLEPSSPPLTPLVHHIAPSWAPCAIQQLPTSYLFCTWCIYVSLNSPPLSSCNPHPVSTNLFSTSAPLFLPSK